jgi:ATP-dependent DNA ligase
VGDVLIVARWVSAMGKRGDKSRRLVVAPPVPPMLARTVPSLPVGSGWAYEPKFDGYRMLVFRSKAEVKLQSRQQRMLTTHFPDIAAAVAGVARTAVLDGVISSL